MPLFELEKLIGKKVGISKVDFRDRLFFNILTKNNHPETKQKIRQILKAIVLCHSAKAVYSGVNNQKVMKVESSDEQALLDFAAMNGFNYIQTYDNEEFNRIITIKYRENG